MPTNGKHVDNEQLDREIVEMARRVDGPTVAAAVESILRELRNLNDPKLRELVIEFMNDRFAKGD